MRHLATFLVITLAAGLAAQSDYKVIKVNGSILYTRTGSSMAQGDVFSENEDLEFATPSSRAAVINPDKGRFILTAASLGNVVRAKSNFLPAMSNISTRGGALNTLADLQNQFSGTMVVLHRASWFINPYPFPMTEDTYFYLQFLYKGQTVEKRLPFDGNHLIFDRGEILKTGGEPIAAPDTPNAILYYNGKDGVQYISVFLLVFPELGELADECAIILEASQDEAYASLVNELSGYIFEFYGKPDKQDVMLFMKTDLGVED